MLRACSGFTLMIMSPVAAIRHSQLKKNHAFRGYTANRSTTTEIDSAAIRSVTPENAQ
jgi:hypothetical protein